MEDIVLPGQLEAILGNSIVVVYLTYGIKLVGERLNVVVEGRGAMLASAIASGLMSAASFYMQWQALPALPADPWAAPWEWATAWFIRAGAFTLTANLIYKKVYKPNMPTGSVARAAARRAAEREL